MSRNPKLTLYAVCPACATVAGQGSTMAELVVYSVCPTCGGPCDLRRTKPGAKGRKRHHGGLTRRRYLDPPTLLAFRKFIQSRARERNAAAGWTDHVVVEILGGSGLRAGELTSTQEHPDRFLRIGDVVLNPVDPAIHVRQGKGEVSRVVRITPALGKLLGWYIATYRAEAGDEEPLVESPEVPGKPLYYLRLSNWCRIWARQYAEYVEAQPAPKRRPLGLALTPHVFRHSFAVDFVQKNPGKLHVLQELLGHADLETTMVYVHTLAVDVRACMAKMQ